MGKERRAAYIEDLGGNADFYGVVEWRFVTFSSTSWDYLHTLSRIVKPNRNLTPGSRELSDISEQKP